MEKKKKPALGAFVTLDAGDVEKTIDTFNDSVSDGIGSMGMVESKTEKKEEKWEDVYEQFEDIMEQYFPSVEIINSKVDELYEPHKGEEDWDTAYEKWTGSEKDEITESLNEAVDEYINITPLEDIREGSIGNMDDDEIDAQERTFSNIVRKLKSSDSDVVAIKYDEGYYDYDPQYIDSIKFDVKSDRYGNLYSTDGLVFYKEKAYPFLYFRSEEDVEKYINLYNKEMGE